MQMPIVGTGKGDSHLSSPGRMREFYFVLAGVLNLKTSVNCIEDSESIEKTMS
jgi:hypothetical protein